MTLDRDSNSFVQSGQRFVALVYLVLGILGFLPFDFINPMHHSGIGVPYLFNLVAINALHNFVHLSIGISGLVATRTLAGAQLWGKIAGSILLLLFILGMVQAAIEGFPNDQLLWGLIPLNSPGHMLHLVSGGLTLYLGLIRTSPTATKS
jgi:hypothetical protein